MLARLPFTIRYRGRFFGVIAVPESVDGIDAGKEVVEGTGGGIFLAARRHEQQFHDTSQVGDPRGRQIIWVRPFPVSGIVVDVFRLPPYTTAVPSSIPLTPLTQLPGSKSSRLSQIHSIGQPTSMIYPGILGHLESSLLWFRLASLQPLPLRTSTGVRVFERLGEVARC